MDGSTILVAVVAVGAGVNSDINEGLGVLMGLEV